LLGEGVALFFLGVLCPELDAAERWQRTGWKIIQQEAQRQVRADGFHFEQSTYYHVYALDFFLHATILATANQWPVPIALEETVEKMLSALGLLCPAGLPPRWGDDDGGRVFDPRRNRAEHMLDPLATGAILFRRGDFKAAVGQLREETIWLLGPQGVKVWDGVDTQAANIGSTALAASGFYLFPSVTPSAFLAVDCGPMGTQSGGHGHADSLSLTLQSEGCELLIDPGTFTYASAGGERNRFRGTAMHNTLKVDALDQAEPTGPFSWRRLPRCKREKWIQGKRFDLLVASHDGYGRLPQPVTHQRWVFSLQNGIYLVRDCVHGQGEHRLEYFWHLGSEMEQVEGTRFRVKGGSRGLAILYDDVAFPEPQLADSGWSPAYGQRAPARSVTFSRTADLPSASSILLVTLQEALEFQGKFEQLACNDGDGSLSAYRFTAENAEYNFFFAEGGRVWRHGFLSSDAEFICWSREAKNDAQRLILINGSHAEIGEDVELRFRRTILWAELARGKNQREIFSSDLEALADDVASV
jgi:hypothetical protein